MLMLFLKDVLMLPDDSVFRFDTKACSHSSPKVRSLLSSHILPVLSPPSLVSSPFLLSAAIKQK